ncbi:MAG: hypothetical protein PHP42_08345 [Bacteroidota bacterium]|nr:hypothetical protein [Bacteroidota bacterium]
MANELKEIQERLEHIAMECRTVNGLKNNYVFCRQILNSTIIYLKVSEFKESYFTTTDGAIFPYLSLGGYCFPPAHVIEQVRSKESGIRLHSKQLES